MTVPAQSKDLLGKPVSELISADTYVAEDGSVQGTLNKVTGYTGFSSKVEEQEGYFFPFNLTQTGTTMDLIKNGVPTKSGIPFDPEVILKIADTNAEWTIKVDGTQVVKLTFKEANFAE